MGQFKLSHFLLTALSGGLANEFYILGAETGTGKSAFLMSMAQHMAAEGVNVLYFSMEMGIDEFIARGISMLSFEKHLADTREETYTTGDILYYTRNPETNNFCNTEGDMSICFRYYPAHSYFVETKGYGEPAACSRYTGEQDKKKLLKKEKRRTGEKYFPCVFTKNGLSYI